MTKHLNMRPTQIVNRSAASRGRRWPAVALIGVCALGGWMSIGISVEPPQPVEAAVVQLRQQIAYDVSEMRYSIGDLFR